MRKRCSTSFPSATADALLHVIRMFRDETVPHAPGRIDPPREAQAMEDELILADLGVVERRLERLARDLKKGATPELQREQQVLMECLSALEGGRPLRTLQLAADDQRRLRGFQFLSAKPLLLVLNLDEADVARADDAVALAGLTEFAGHARRARGAGLREDRARDLAPRCDRCRGVSGRSAAEGIGPGPRDSRDLRLARLHVVLHGGRGRMPGLVDSARHRRADRRRRDPQ